MSIWDYRKNFAYDEPLAPGDERRVNLNEARGSYNRDRLLRALGIDVQANELRDPPSGKYVLFGGHRGCGKSTELLEIANRLRGAERFFVVQIDALKALDINNLDYADVALALAESLAETAVAAEVPVPDVFVQPLHNWFRQVNKTIVNEFGIGAELVAGVDVGSGLPFLGKLFAKLTGAIRSNNTYKKEIRESVRNSFTDLADSFCKLLAHIDEEVKRKQKGRGVIFVIDGTDRLSGGEAEAFFVRDIHQLRMLRANCIFCAPISILNEQGQIAQNFDEISRLPMIKLAQKGKFDDLSSRIESAWSCMREFVTKRLPVEYFDDLQTLDLLIAHSGGHPRDLLRLVNFCFQEIDEGPITRAVAVTATVRLSNEYKRLVQPSDFPLLVEIDSSAPDFAPATDQTRRLLYDLTLLEYNSYWWQSHPAVRALEAYRTSQLQR